MSCRSARAGEARGGPPARASRAVPSLWTPVKRETYVVGAATASGGPSNVKPRSPAGALRHERRDDEVAVRVLALAVRLDVVAVAQVLVDESALPRGHCVERDRAAERTASLAAFSAWRSSASAAAPVAGGVHAHAQAPRPRRFRAARSVRRGAPARRSCARGGRSQPEVVPLDVPRTCRPPPTPRPRRRGRAPSTTSSSRSRTRSRRPRAPSSPPSAGSFFLRRCGAAGVGPLARRSRGSGAAPSSPLVLGLAFASAARLLPASGFAPPLVSSRPPPPA